MGLLLVLIGILIWFTISPIIGAILIVVGLVALFVPNSPYGYSWYRGRRGP